MYFFHFLKEVYLINLKLENCTFYLVLRFMWHEPKRLFTKDFPMERLLYSLLLDINLSTHSLFIYLSISRFPKWRGYYTHCYYLSIYQLTLYLPILKFPNGKYVILILTFYVSIYLYKDFPMGRLLYLYPLFLFINL